MGAAGPRGRLRGVHGPDVVDRAVSGDPAAPPLLLTDQRPEGVEQYEVVYLGVDLDNGSPVYAGKIVLHPAPRPPQRKGPERLP